jgi:hypothetical protein
MTREEAIRRLRYIRMDYLGYPPFLEPIDMAIEALQEPKTIMGIDIPYGSDKGIATLFKGKDDKLILKEVKEIMSVVRCKDCMHRHEDECPMYHEEWFTIDEGDGYVDDDYNVIDKTNDDGFCQYGERREP